MKKQFFYAIPVVLTWVLGHALLYVYLNRLLPYATINLFTAIVWLLAIIFSHYKWSTFMGWKVINLLKA